LARVLFLLPNSPFTLIRHYYPFFYGKQWADTLHNTVGYTPVVFENSYVLPSLYTYYYTGAKAIDYNTKSYRKTNYNLENDCALSGQKVWHYQMTRNPDSTLVYIDTRYSPGVLRPIEKFTCINALKIEAGELPETLKTNSTYPVTLTLNNKSLQSIEAFNPLEIDYAFFIAKSHYINSDESYKITTTQFGPGENQTRLINLKAPGKPGVYKLLFSLKNRHLQGNFASPFYTVRVE